MKVTLNFVAYLDVRGVSSGDVLDLKEGTTIADLLSQLAIAPEHQEHITPVVSGVSRRRHETLEDGDDLTLLLPVAGG